MNYAIDTANLDVKQQISLCKLLIPMVSILHLQGELSVCSLKGGAIKLCCHCQPLARGVYEDFYDQVDFVFLKIHQAPHFFLRGFQEHGCLVGKNPTLLSMMELWKYVQPGGVHSTVNRWKCSNSFDNILV